MRPLREMRPLFNLIIYVCTYNISDWLRVHECLLVISPLPWTDLTYSPSESTDPESLSPAAMPDVNLAFAATFCFLFYGLCNLIHQILHLYFSALREIPGPKSNSFIFGHSQEVQGIEGSTLLHDWIGQYGKIIKIKLFLGVRLSLAEPKVQN